MDDYISRQMAIEAVQNRHMMLSKEKVLLINDLEKLPSTQPTFDARDTQYNLPIGTDLISRAEAIAMCRKPCMRNADCSDFEMEIMMLPSAQPEPSQVARDIARIVENEKDMRVIAQPEIIRCKDCKHWIPYDWMFSEVWQSQNIDDYPEDEIGCQYCDMAMKANDFCSRAERRDDG